MNIHRGDGKVHFTESRRSRQSAILDRSAAPLLRRKKMEAKLSHGQAVPEFLVKKYQNGQLVGRTKSIDYRRTLILWTVRDSFGCR